MNIQVEDGYYKKDYDKLTRFASYYHQIKCVNSLKPDNILEIGIGNKTVSSYLKNMEYQITTCDFDQSLDPDIVADVRKMPLESKSFDLVMSCEVLEHIAWKDFDVALKELHRISKKYVIISLPYASLCFEWLFKFPFADKITKEHFIYFKIRIPLWLKHKFDGQHYWEIGKRGYSLNRIRKSLKKYFKIIDESSPYLSPYNYFFILEKNENTSYTDK